MKQNPPYKHLVQKIHFCGPTCIQMILFRKGHWVEQEWLAMKMGTRVRNETAHIFNANFETNEEGDAGIRIEEFSKIKEFLAEYKLELEIITADKISDLRKLIIDNLKQSNDIIINFNRIVYNPQKNWGHYSLINAIDEENDVVELCDPSGDDKYYWNTSVEKLNEAISPKWDGKDRGIVIVKEIEKKEDKN
jgi:hypothetical protein